MLLVEQGDPHSFDWDVMPVIGCVCLESSSNVKMTPFLLSTPSGIPARNHPTAGGSSALQHLFGLLCGQWSYSTASRPEPHPRRAVDV